jgi:hypothetical protein
VFFRKKKRPNANVERVVDHLIESAYLKYVLEAEKELARQELCESLEKGYLDTNWNEDCVSRDRRGYPADNEELAEGSIGESLLRMRDILLREGVESDFVSDDLRDDGYDISINGNIIPIYDASALSSANIWGIALKRFLEIVNNLLIRAGSAERLFGVYGGNDGRAILLTEEMYAYLKSIPVVLDERWMPFRSTAISDEGKWLGREQ